MPIERRPQGTEQETRGRKYLDRYLGFPDDLTFADFHELSPEVRKQVLLRNPILRTDTYNRTMEYLTGESWKTPATYTLQMRRSQYGYLVAAGVSDLAQSLADTRITTEQIDFAKEYFSQTGGIRFFNEKKWRYVAEECGGQLPLSIDAVPDGTVVLPGDPVVRVSGPNELVAHFEPDFHRLFYPTLVATNAHEIARKIEPGRFIEVGLRGAVTDEQHLAAAKAMYIGGGLTYTSSDMAAAYYPRFTLVGTLGHRYVQSFEGEEQAFRHAVERLDAVTLLVDLNDTIAGIEIALRLKREFRETGKKIWLRLDSGDVKEQALYALDRQRQEGFLDPLRDKVVVEGIDDIEEISKIDKACVDAGFNPEAFIVYGAGGLLISDHTSRKDASTGFKLSQLADRPTIKFSDSPGKASLPGVPTLVMVEGKRVIAQESEFSSGDLLVPYISDGVLTQEDYFEKARASVDTSFDQVRDDIQARSRSGVSARTNELVVELKQRRTEGGEEK